MLCLFATNAGRVLSKQELMEAVWPNVHVGEDGLFQCIREIRAALGDEQRQMIKLVSGRGYLFALDVSAEPAAPASHRADAPPGTPPPGGTGLTWLPWSRWTSLAAAIGLGAILG